MVKYTLRRILWMIPIVLAVAILIFTLMTLCPGDPASIILGSTATQADLDAKTEELGLNDPYLVRLADFLVDTFLKFDLGKSWTTNVKITTTLAERFPRTFLLTVTTLVIAYGIGIPLGILAATHQNGLLDNLCMVLAMIGVSIPNFWLGLMLVLLFAVNLGWLPAMGITDGFASYILPAVTACMGPLATCARQTRSSMLEVIRADYITTARAKGVKERDVIYKHALKNAMLPIITMMGSNFGNLLGGMLIIETVFSIPGMGSFVVTAVGNRDYPVVQSGTIVLAITFSICMLLVDLLYAAVDPRIKAQYAAGSRKKVKAPKKKEAPASE